jgi:hypothetical protein
VAAQPHGSVAQVQVVQQIAAQKNIRRKENPNLKIFSFAILDFVAHLHNIVISTAVMFSSCC